MVSAVPRCVLRRGRRGLDEKTERVKSFTVVAGKRGPEGTICTMKKTENRGL